MGLLFNNLSYTIYEQTCYIAIYIYIYIYIYCKLNLITWHVVKDTSACIVQQVCFALNPTPISCIRNILIQRKFFASCAVTIWMRQAFWLKNQEINMTYVIWYFSPDLEILGPTGASGYIGYYDLYSWYIFTWWRYQMATFSALLALCEVNPPVTSGIISKRPVTRSVDVFIQLCLNKRFSKQSWAWCLRSHRAHYDVTDMTILIFLKINLMVTCNVCICLDNRSDVAVICTIITIPYLNISDRHIGSCLQRGWRTKIPNIRNISLVVQMQLKWMKQSGDSRM